MNSSFEPIIHDLISLKDEIADNNDLFLRTVKLLQLGQALNQTPNNAVQQTPNNDNRAFILGAVDHLLSVGKLNPALVKDLLDPAFSKSTFGLMFTFLKKIEDITPDTHKRYYARVFNIDGVLYRITSQWYKAQRANFDTWYKKIC